jgi:hypothetical protein
LAPEKNEIENLMVIDLKGLLFLDLNIARGSYTFPGPLQTLYELYKDKFPNLVQGSFHKVIDRHNNLVQFSPEAEVLSRTAFIQVKPLGSKKDYPILCRMPQ